MSHRGIQLTDERDFPLLRFLWRWKVSTTAILASRFFPSATLERAYRRLLDLEKNKFIIAKSGRNGKAFVWQLQSKGFEAIRPYLPSLENDGFLSECIEHDLITSALQMGPWITCEPKEIEIFTEQELRCISPVCYPEWIPKEMSRRPDGITRTTVSGNEVIIGLETELSLKRPKKYEVIGKHYSETQGLDRVLWITRNPSHCKIIYDALLRGTGRKAFIHNFVSLSQFTKSNWKSIIELGPEKGQPVSFLIGGPIAPPPNFGVGVGFLDVRKKPSKSQNSRTLEIGDFVDRLGITIPNRPSPNFMDQ